MPYNLSKTIAGRSVQQSNANTETIQAVVKRTYTDSNGNVIAADVRVPNGGADIIRVENQTPYKLSVSDTVQLNYVNGQRHYRAITGALGSGVVSAANAEAQQDSGSNQPVPLPPSIALAGVPFLLQDYSSVISGGYVEEPGSNVYFLDSSPESGSSGSQIDGTRVISMKRIVVPILPSPYSLPVGTLADLVDSYGSSRGMFRLDSTYGWVREDIGDHKVQIDQNDQAPGYLGTKISAGPGISITQIIVGGVPTLEISLA